MEKSKTNFIAIVLLLSLNMMPAFSQSGPLMRIESIMNTNVNVVTSGSNGSMWIGTSNGLCLFDGNSSREYNNRNSCLKSNYIESLLYDSERNELWVGTHNGLYIMDCSTQTLEQIEIEGIFNVFDIKYSIDRQSVWIVNVNWTIVCVRLSDRSVRARIRIKDYEDIPYTFVAMEEISDGHILVGHPEDGVSVIDYSLGEAVNYVHSSDDSRSICSNEVTCIYKDDAGRIWIGTKNGVSRYDVNSGSFVNFNSDAGGNRRAGTTQSIGNYVSDIKWAGDDRLWIATYGNGINILNLNSRTVERFDVVNSHSSGGDWNRGMPSGKINCIYKDFYGNMWIGHAGGGLFLSSHVKNMFTSVGENVYGITSMPCGDVIFGEEERLSVWRNGNCIETHDLSHLAFPDKPVIKLIYPTDNEHLLICPDQNGLYYYSLKTREARYIPLFGERYDVDCITPDPFSPAGTDSLLVGTNNGVFRISSAGTGAYRLHGSSSFLNHIITDIVPTDNGCLWISTGGSGIYIVDREFNKVDQVNAEKDIKSNSVNCMVADGHGGIWFGTSLELCHVRSASKPHELEEFYLEDSKNNVITHSICIDRYDNVWVSNTNAIGLLKKGENFVYKFDVQGLHHEVHGGFYPHSAYCHPSGESVMLGSIYGAAILDAKAILYQSHEGGVKDFQIHGVYLITPDEHDSLLYAPNGKPSDEVTLRLHYDSNSLRIVFGVGDYGYADVVEYSYSFGKDGHWVSLNNETSMTLRNLSPGDYDITFRARIRGKNWSDAETRTLHIHIGHPIWSSWYAILFYVILFLAICIYFVRSYTRRTFLEGSLRLERIRRQTADEINEDRLRFFTNITHELRTPLTLIIGPLEDLASSLSDLPGDALTRLKSINESARRLLTLVNQILEFRTIETGNKQLVVAEANLSADIEEQCLHFVELSKDAGCTVSFDIESGIVILYDQDVISTILSNFVSNALKYTPHGEVRISLRRSDKRVELSVSDTGYGIAPEEQQRIFSSYYQVKNKYQASGTGIGLALVKSLCALHKLDLGVSSEVGKGSRFWIAFDTECTYPDAIHTSEREEPETIQPSIAEGSDAGNGSMTGGERPLVLIVEDNTGIRDYIAQSLSADYNTLTASNGREGWEMTQTDIPDIIISDIMMPEMDGLELCRIVKSDVRTSHIPILLLTARSSMADREAGYACGADSYIPKPFSSQLILSRLANLIQNRRRLMELSLPLPNLTIHKMPATAEDADYSIDTDTTSPAGTEASHEMTSPETFTDENNDVPAVRVSTLDKRFIEKLNEVINANIDNDGIDAAFFTDKMAMIYSTLYRKVKSLTGCSLTEYIRRIRLAKSVEMMRDDTNNITDITYACGFGTQRYFRACFKKEFGMSPSQYMKKLWEQS